MKRNLLRLTLLVMVGSLMMASSSCKKGDNDPAISLRSRTARLAGEWKLSSADYTTLYTDDDYSNTTKYTYDGTILTEISTATYGGTSNTSTETDTYSDALTIEKDGTFKRVITRGTEITTYEGNWTWLKGNDNQEIKNKQAIAISTTKYTRVNGNSTSYYQASGKDNFSDVFVIDRLANNEMVLLVDYKEVDDDGSTSTHTGTRTYTQD